jgi:hypothetical protein
VAGAGFTLHGLALYKKKGASPLLTMPLVFAGDPAPQQLTAPCRKYSGRLHPGIEQVVCLPVPGGFPAVFIEFSAHRRRLAPAPRTKM